MTCSGCAAKITATLQKNPKVESAIIDYATASGVVSGALTHAETADLIASLGYKVEAIADAPHTAEDGSGSKYAPLFRNWLLAVFLGIPVTVLAMGPWHFYGSSVAQCVLTSLFLMGPAFGFFARATKQAIHGHVTMDALVSTGMLSAWVLSIGMMLTGSDHLYFESATMIGLFVLSGKALEEWARRKSVAEVDRLVRLRPQKAFVIDERGQPVEKAVGGILVGDFLYVRPGDMLAVDGAVIDGEISFDESIITGESHPVLRSVGELVPAGAINAGATGVKLKVVKIGKETAIEKIIALVEDARMSRPPVQKLADQISAVFVPAVFVLSLATCLVWRFVSGKSLVESAMVALSVLVVACPCALGLATPVAWVAGLGAAARRGILVRSYEALEVFRKAKVLVFDKTGTLTNGRPRVVKVRLGSGAKVIDLEKLKVLDERTLNIFVSALVHSSHPHARAIFHWLKSNVDCTRVPLSKVIAETAGQGVECEVRDGDRRFNVRFGKPNFVTDQDISILLQGMDEQNSAVGFSVNNELKYIFELSDALRPDALATLAELIKRRFRVILASGDKESVVKSLFTTLKMTPFDPSKSTDEAGVAYQAEMTPAGKLKLVELLQKRGAVVAFVGDGINDAPALAAADVAVAMGSGSDMATGNAGLVIRTTNVAALLDAIDLSSRITNIIRQNFFLAFIYNVAAIPLAMAGLMSPMWASAAMALSSVSVVMNALRLRR
jgi:Cu+-exporting ATPase